MITGVFIDNFKLDLFDDEKIKVKSVISKIEDITKIFTDTSNDFTIPASANNLEAINHWYESDVVNGFDARKKVPALIELNGVNYKFGKIRLNKVNFKNGQPDNISIGYFGGLVDLKDILGDDKLNDLDLSAFNFDYNYHNTRIRLSLATNDVVFSLLSKRRFLYDSVGTVEDTDKQTNIYYNGTDDNTGIKITDLTASIKQLRIIEAIEAKYPLSFSRDFFGLYDFSNQFLALTGTDVLVETQVELTNVRNSVDPSKSGNAILVLGDIAAENQNTEKINFFVVVSTADQDKEYNMYIKSNGVVKASFTNVKGFNRLEMPTNSVDGLLENVTFWVESETSLEYYGGCYRLLYSPRIGYEHYGVMSTPDIKFNVSKRLPEIKTIDYLKGLFKMFKLVAIPQEDGTIYIDSLVNYYSKGQVIDLSKYIDYSSFTVSSGSLFNEIKYKFEDPQTLLNQQYKKNNGVGYGDLEHSIYDENGVLIDGKKLDFKLPFEQIVYEKISDLGDGETDTNVQYGLLLNETLDTVDIKPHIHYVIKRDSVVKLIDDNGVGIATTGVNVPSHVSDFNTQTYSTTFGNEFNEFDGSLITNTLFSNYHKSFINNVFNSQKREYNYKAKNVPEYIIQSLSLNDVIEIKGKLHRIEEFTVNTLNSDVDFKLFNVQDIGLTAITYLTTDLTYPSADDTLLTIDETTTDEVIVLDSEAPNKPINVFYRLNNIFTKSVVSWFPSYDNVGVTNYKVYLNGVLVDTVGNVTTSEIDRAGIGIPDNITVTALDSVGNESEHSDLAAFDSIPPSEPTNVQTQTVMSNSFRAFWTHSTDNISLEGYNVYLDNVLYTSKNQYQNFVDVTSLTSSTSYDLEISAFDTAGNESARSTTLTVTTTS